MSRLALVCYSLLMYLLRPVLLLLFVWRSRADAAYRQRFIERFALQPIPAQLQGGLLVHAVSMGEVVAAIPLILAHSLLQSRFTELSNVLEQRRWHPWFGGCTRDEFLARVRAPTEDANALESRYAELSSHTI